MSEYIEKEAVINFIENGLNNPDKTKSFGHDAIEIMAEVRYMPAADVVEVVRCKDCAIPHNRFTGCPNLNGLIPPENHFCSFGERKESDNNG